MTARKSFAIAVCVLAFGACTKSNDGGAHAGSGAAGGSAATSGAGGKSAGGAGGSSNDCGNLAIPTLCRVCSDGSCGTPVCTGGKFTGFVCPNDGGTGGAAGSAGSGGGVCNLLCVKGKHCVAKPTPTCVDDVDAGTAGAGAAPSCGGFAGLPCPGLGTCVDVPNDGCDPRNGGADCSGACECTALAKCKQGSMFDSSPSECACKPASSGALHWFASCGTPVCQVDGGMFDDPNIPNCTTEQIDQACTSEGARCDGVLSCGQTLICAQAAPSTCPRSRAVYKRDISYLGDAERAQFHEQITQLRLASYRYKSAPDVPQLGFMIDDIEPSVAVAGDHVNLYAYLSMAVAAIQVQDQKIKGLQRELEQLRSSVQPAAPLVCEPVLSR